MPDKAEEDLWIGSESANVVTYASVLNAWAKSGREDAGQFDQFQLLERMKAKPEYHYLQYDDQRD
jgi:hypothetical protein